MHVGCCTLVVLGEFFGGYFFVKWVRWSWTTTASQHSHPAHFTQMCPPPTRECERSASHSTLVAPYCATPRDYLSDTPLLRAMGFLVSQHGQLGAKRGISAILARYPRKARQMGAIPPSAILSRKGIARYGGVSRTGPLSTQPRGTRWP